MSHILSNWAELLFSPHTTTSRPALVCLLGSEYSSPKLFQPKAYLRQRGPGGLPPRHTHAGMREADMSQREFIVEYTATLSPPGRGLSLTPQKTGKGAFPMPADLLQKWKPSFKTVTSSQVANSPGPLPRAPSVCCVGTGWGSSPGMEGGRSPVAQASACQALPEQGSLGGTGGGARAYVKRPGAFPSRLRAGPGQDSKD